jgi:hypothetical protein
MRKTTVPGLLLAMAIPWFAGFGGNRAAVAGELPANIVQNGDFGLDADNDGFPDGWGKSKGMSVQRDAGKAWLLIDGGGVGTSQKISLDPSWHKLNLTMRMRATDVVVGDEGWKDARLAMSFADAQGQRVGDWPNVFNASGKTDWIGCERSYVIPKGAAALLISPANYGTSGKVEFGDIAIAVVQERPRKEDLQLPAGVEDPWDPQAAEAVATRTRGRICINGLWRFIPVLGEAAGTMPPPGEGWGWFKVPGMWPGSAAWDVGAPAQRVLLAPCLETEVDFAKMDQAWYRREITVPAEWSGRRVFLEFTMLQTHAQLFVDEKPAGEMWFPGGRIEVTDAIVPGKRQSLAVLVTARPLEAESNVFMAPDRVLSTKATLKMKGIAGDVFLVGEPQENAIADVLVLPSTRRGEIRLDVGLVDAPRVAGKMKMSATIRDQGVTVMSFASAPFAASDLKGNRFSFAASWPDAKRWDTDSPGNMYEVSVALATADGELLDEFTPERFGFREFWIDGRNFMLNGSPIHLRSLFVRSICDYADRASLAGCLSLCGRSAEYGFNFLITSNYGFSPGLTGYMDALYEAADRTGMLVSCSLPHVKDHNWLKTPEDQARYRELTRWIIRRVQNHPSIVTYAMNHNATGYYGDQNPQKIDGVYDPATIDDPAFPVSKEFVHNRVQAEVAAGIAKACDPSRPVYHHSSGNLGDLHTINIYLNWAPLQERSDWLGHWATAGVKPLFFVEWGMPHVGSWSSYRGPEFIWRASVFQQIWDSEFAAAYVGERAYAMTPTKVEMTRKEESLWAAGNPFHFSNLCSILEKMDENYLEIQGLFIADNWRSHRTWGISAMLPWDQAGLWRRVKETPTREVPDSYQDLQRPGIVPDIVTAGKQYIYDMDEGSFAPSPLGKSFRRWNMPLLAYIGGGADGFTEKSRNFTPGETVEKRLVIVNDTRRDRSCTYTAGTSFGSERIDGKVVVPAGGKVFVPVSHLLPKGLKDSAQHLSATFDFGDGEVQEDEFELRVVASVTQGGGVWSMLGMGGKEWKLASTVELFDPRGLTAAVLDDLGVRYRMLKGNAPGEDCDILIIGREALADPALALDLSRITSGLKVVVFEQTHETLQNRFGLRGTVLGLRNAFVRVPSHPVLAGLSEENFRDWRGAATLTPPYLETELFETHDPRWTWCGFESTRVWRCGNRGNVASVLIEKPAKGDWLPLLDGGFDLQYSPLLQHVEGEGCIIFCQLDVSGRTERDPAALAICRNLLAYLDTFTPPCRRTVAYVGGKEGAAFLRTLGVAFTENAKVGSPAETLLVIGGGDEASVAGLLQAVEAGMSVLGLGLNEQDLDRLMPGVAKAKSVTQVSTMASDLSLVEYAGVSNADLHWRTVLPFAALEDVPPENGTAALAVVARGKGRIVLCQAAPWNFDYVAKPYVRTTYRRNGFLVSRLLANLGAPFAPIVSAKFASREPIFSVALADGWRGEPDRTQVGKDQGWWQAGFDDSAWAPIKVPGKFDVQRQDLDGYDGVFWYRLRFKVQDDMDVTKLKLWIGAVDDESWVWLNDEFLGEVTKATHPKDYWAFPREYALRSGLLRKGAENVLVIRVNDTYRNGGIVGSPELRGRFPWLDGPCLQEPIADDNPYRYYRW